jgi:hypothetical protein
MNKTIATVKIQTIVRRVAAVRHTLVVVKHRSRFVTDKPISLYFYVRLRTSGFGITFRGTYHKKYEKIPGEKTPRKRPDNIAFFIKHKVVKNGRYVLNSPLSIKL